VSTSPTLSDYLQNALPTWLGGSPVTANELAQNQANANAEIQAVGQSPGAQVPAWTLVSNDLAMVNGKTYLFVFNGPGVTTSNLASDIDAQAPDFITLSSVTALDGGGLAVQFNYEGDGSDLVQDVASSIIAAALQGNNDSLSFVSASTQTQLVSQTIAPVIVAQVAASNADQANLAQQANKAAAAADTAQLTSIIVWVGVGIAAFLFLTPKFLAATTPRVSVGGGA
jgi:hypothetical protein